MEICFEIDAVEIMIIYSKYISAEIFISKFTDNEETLELMTEYLKRFHPIQK